MTEAVGFLAVGTFWFWMLVIVANICVFYWYQSEYGFLAFFTVVTTVGLLHFFGNSNLFYWLADNPWRALTYAFLYFVVGTVWSVIKWWSFIVDMKELYDELKVDFLRSHRPSYVMTGEIPDNLKELWREKWAQKYIVYCRKEHNFYFSSTTDYTGDTLMPKARDHKKRILRWMTYWPWSMLATVLRNFVRRIFNFIYLKIQILFQKIADSAFKGVEADFLHTPEQSPKTDV